MSFKNMWLKKKDDWEEEEEETESTLDILSIFVRAILIMFANYKEKDNFVLQLFNLKS